MEILSSTNAIAAAELEYVRAARIFDSQWSDERQRRLKVQNLLLESDCQKLKDQITEADCRVEELLLEKDTLEDERSAAITSYEELQTKYRSRMRELQQLQTEIGSLQNVSTNSSRLLSEKLALAHELSTLKPELEHLRSQSAVQQAMVSEKLSLQRQLSTIQVELENEKRTAQRAIAKGERGNVKENKLEEQIEELQSALSREKKAREQAEKERRKSSDDWESKKSVFESKLEALKGKLRTAESKLSETQAQLRRAEAAATQSQSAAAEAKPSRKRGASRMIDEQIGTPGPVHKKGRRTTTLPGNVSFTKVGEKSTFSITPIINRTRPSTEVVADTAPGPVAVEAESSKQATTKATTPPPIPAPSQELPIEPTPKKATRKSPSKARVTLILPEEEKAKESTSGATKENQDPVAPLAKEEPKKKRRRLLAGAAGKTLFDVDDEPEPKKGGDIFGLARAGRASKTAPSGFGAFSPLKKDRRAASSK